MGISKYILLLFLIRISSTFPSIPLDQNASNSEVRGDTVTSDKEVSSIGLSSTAKTPDEVPSLQPPRCSEIEYTPVNSSRLKRMWSNPHKYILHIGVGETICFKSEEENTDGQQPLVLHTLTFSELKQTYPVRETYEFGIPEVNASCICDCSSKSEVCNPDKYRNGACDSSGPDTACHHTFFDNQPSTGCSGMDVQPRLCCDISFRPYQNKVYTALKLEDPSLYVSFRYASYQWEAGKWTETETRNIGFILGSGTTDQFMDSSKRFFTGLLSTSNSINRLDSGMYFVENFEDGSYGELIKQSLNEEHDNNFNRFGWFRKNNTGHFYVKNGDIMIDKIHRAMAKHCGDQKYESILDASYYVNKNSLESTKFKIAKSVNNVNKWIKSAKIEDPNMRQVNVIENEGTELAIMLTNYLPHTKFTFIHNISVIENFTATIVVDKYSNSYLNITVINASGTIRGSIRHYDDMNAENLESFTMFVPGSTPVTKRLIKPINQYAPNTRYVICVRPNPHPNFDEICRLVESKYEELFRNEFQKSRTEENSFCPDCNKSTVLRDVLGFFFGVTNSLVRLFNPTAWKEASSSVEGFIMMMKDAITGILVFFVFYFCITKIVFPLIKCCLCPTIPCFTRKKK